MGAKGERGSINHRNKKIEREHNLVRGWRNIVRMELGSHSKQSSGTTKESFMSVEESESSESDECV